LIKDISKLSLKKKDISKLTHFLSKVNKTPGQPKGQGTQARALGLKILDENKGL